MHTKEHKNKKIVSVAVPLPLDGVYSYFLPEEYSEIADGSYVKVNFGNRATIGVIWKHNPDSSSAPSPADKIKTIEKIYDFPAMDKKQIEFISKVSSYNLTPKGSILKISVSSPELLEPPQRYKAYKINNNFENASVSSQRKKIIDILSREKSPLRASEITKLTGCSNSTINSMFEAGLLNQIEISPPPPCVNPSYDKKPILSEQQNQASERLREISNANKFATILLDGVTGSGKTEVYFEAISQTLDHHRQAVLMLPEISLSNAFLERFKKRFGCYPGVWHSKLSKGERKSVWQAVVKGECKVVIGARSSLFLPYSDLGLIIVDEEHDSGYKQEDHPIYHARDMAVLKASIEQIPVILVSATPSLETVHNTTQGRYERIHLPARYGGASLPEIKIVDMRNDKPETGSFISKPLISAVDDTLKQKHQSLLFLNRRGYAPLTICRTCGHRIECPRCTAWLVEHKRTQKLQCHMCGYETKMPEQCPSCKTTGSLTACGPGVERIKQEAEQYWPDARITVMASDMISSDTELRKMITDIEQGKFDIIIGTQIISKGHNFPLLNCVGVIDADLGLSGGDLRAGEKTYQLLHQVAGRAGRTGEKGTVILQSFNPHSRVIASLAQGDRDNFIIAETEERNRAFMPPFSRLVAIIISSADEKLSEETAILIGKKAPIDSRIKILGPAPAQIYRIRGKYRRRFLIIAPKNIDIQKMTRCWIESIKTPSNVQISIDIDPQSFF